MNESIKKVTAKYSLKYSNTDATADTLKNTDTCQYR